MATRPIYKRNNVSKIERKEKIQNKYIYILTTSLINNPLISYTNPPPMSMTTLISKLLPLFVTSDKGVSTSSRHLIITRQASLISIIIAGAIVTLILKCLGRRRGNHNETTHNSLSSCNATNMGVHLTQLIAKSVKASIHAHKLCHDSCSRKIICKCTEL